MTETKSSKPVLVVPFSSRRRILSWIRSRFEISRRREFWIITVCMAIVVICSSGNLLGVLFALPTVGSSMIGSALFGGQNPMDPFLHNDLVTEWGGRFLIYVEHLRENSPIDRVLEAIAIRSINSIAVASNDSVFVLAFIAASVFVLLAVRMFRTPAVLALSEQGISLIYRAFFISVALPTIPWSDIKNVSLMKRKDHTSLDGVLRFSCERLPALYRLISPLKSDPVDSALSKHGKLGSVDLDLKNLDNIKQRHQLARKLEELATPESIEPDVLDTLTSTRSAGYTELWLQALSSPSNRQSMNPLTANTMLSDNRFKILGQIGVGGQGTAYFAEDLKAGDKRNSTEGSSSLPAGQTADKGSATVVLKEFVLPLYVDVNSRKAALSRFLDEAEVLKNLDHPGVVKLIECFVEDHRGYVVLERVPGKSLRDLVESEGPLTESKVLSIIDQVLEILSYLHSRQPPVVHRDVAPDNLLMDENGVVKLIDFNVAQQTESTVIGTIVGKQAYVPPEQLRGMSTPRSDIYALGATIHFLLTGRDPEPLTQSHPRVLVEHISENTDELVAQCTAISEEARFQSVEEVQSYRAEDPVGARLKLKGEKHRLNQ